MNKVFYITTESQDVFYVKATDEVEAAETLREAIRKFIFKRTLEGDQSLSTPETLGNNIIVGYAVRASAVDSEYNISDITAQAYVFGRQGETPLWVEWNITEEDALCQKYS